jgi:hypothetical protein
MSSDTKVNTTQYSRENCRKQMEQKEKINLGINKKLEKENKPRKQ